ncbi:40S ribosomal protein S5-like [Zingiber officinale]|uniref:40S ribosomal protein S5-like n=1 Tax=Zingiber officinale TaxID=94328 RepID=UPI001C4B4D07|nr:40S ribosomal protein S5-like [Zingiber officinale]
MAIQQQEVKLFNRWSFDEVEVSDMSLADYIAVTPPKHATYLPHTAGRYSAKRFRKVQCPIIKRLTNSLMMHGRNNGKKLMAVCIIKHAMEIIHLLTDANPIQIVVDAIINRGSTPCSCKPRGSFRSPTTGGLRPRSRSWRVLLSVPALP